MPATRVAVVDDHQLVRIGLKQIIESQPDFTWAGEANTGPGALTLLGGRAWAAALPLVARQGGARRAPADQDPPRGHRHAGALCVSRNPVRHERAARWRERLR